MASEGLSFRPAKRIVRSIQYKHTHRLINTRISKRKLIVEIRPCRRFHQRKIGHGNQFSIAVVCRTEYISAECVRTGNRYRNTAVRARDRTKRNG